MHFNQKVVYKLTLNYWTDLIMNETKVAVLIGTRPGIIKMSPLVHELEKRQHSHILIHSGQHYSIQMDQAIMSDVDLRKPDFYIPRDESWKTHAQQTAYMLPAIEKILMDEKVDVILVCGDANTNFAGALAARKIHVKVGHVEAGLRSFDWRMPEEHNRVMIDHISDYLFAPTERSKTYLLDDGVHGKIFVVGNTIVEASLRNKERITQETIDIIKNISSGKEYILFTSHREENVDNQIILAGFVELLKKISESYQYAIVFPLHPRTRSRLEEFGLMQKAQRIKNLKLIPPLNYLEFLGFLINAKIVMTDSGGIQEESCILNVPCITLRENTERPETVEVGSNVIAGTNKRNILEILNEVHSGNSINKSWPNPFGDGNASIRIIDTAINGKPEDEFNSIHP